MLPFCCGFLYLKLRNESTHEAVFVAAAMVATSVGITARVLQDLHVLKSRAAQIILGAAVFDDILGMVLLAIVVSISSGTGVHWVHLAVVIAEAVGFALFMIYFGPGVVGRMRPGLQRLSTRDAPLMLALATCLLLSVAATKIGMAAIIGAFFAGLIFSDYSPEWGLRPRVYGINEFLAPFFFFTMGARLDIHVFKGGVFVVAVIISVLALVSKIIGCGLPMLKEGWRSALKVGVGMTPRGEVALIVALIGLQMNMVSQRAYAIVIFMTAVTTLVPPPLLRYLFRDEIPPPGVAFRRRGTRSHGLSRDGYNPALLHPGGIHGRSGRPGCAGYRSIAGNRPRLRAGAGQVGREGGIVRPQPGEAGPAGQRDQQQAAARLRPSSWMSAAKTRSRPS